MGTRAGYFTTNSTTENVVEEPLFVFATNIESLDVPDEFQRRGDFQTDLSNEVSRVDRLSRVNAQVDATYFGSLAGQHTLKAGVQFDRRANEVDRGQSANRVNLFWNRGARRSEGSLRLSTGCSATPSTRSAGSSRSATCTTRPSACSCRTRGPCPDRLTINAGLRTENETVPFYSTIGVQDAEPIHFSLRQQAGPSSRGGVGRRR